jgi:hypothetical protein
MRGLPQTSLAVILLFASLSQTDGLGHQNVKRRVQAASVTGSYKFVLNRLEVLELPDHKVRISFLGVWPNERKRVETRNMGSFNQTVSLNGRTALIKLGEGDDQCVISLKFRANKVIAAHEGSILQCGFGFNVEVDGTYVKTSSKPPGFTV